MDINIILLLASLFALAVSAFFRITFKIFVVGGLLLMIAAGIVFIFVSEDVGNNMGIIVFYTLGVGFILAAVEFFRYQRLKRQKTETDE